MIFTLTPFPPSFSTTRNNSVDPVNHKKAKLSQISMTFFTYHDKTNIKLKCMINEGNRKVNYTPRERTHASIILAW